MTPAADRLGEFDHVLLAIAAVHAEGVQLQDFAGEVLVEGSRLSVARQPPSADLRLRADGDDVVQIFQHAGVAADRLEHVGEAAEDVGADRLPLIGRNGGANDGAGPADSEMVRPEKRHPFRERLLGRDGVPGAGDDLGTENAAIEPSRRRAQLFGSLDRAAVHLRQDAVRRSPAGCARRRAPVDLRRDPAARVATDGLRFSGHCAEPEPIERDECRHVPHVPALQQINCLYGSYGSHPFPVVRAGRS